MSIPEDSKIKIEAQLLGGVTLKLLKGNSKNFAEDGDVLEPGCSCLLFAEFTPHSCGFPAARPIGRASVDGTALRGRYRR